MGAVCKVISFIAYEIRLTRANVWAVYHKLCNCHSFTVIIQTWTLILMVKKVLCGLSITSFITRS